MHVSPMMIKELKLVEKFIDMQIHMVLSEDVIKSTHMTISSDFLGLVKEKQLTDPSL